MSGDFYESHCWCLSASTAIFLINLLSPQPSCLFRLFSYNFFPIFLLTPPALDHPMAAVSGSLLVNVYPLFNLNPSHPPHSLRQPAGESWPIDNRSTHSIYCYTNVYGSLQTSEGRQLSLRALINCLWCKREWWETCLKKTCCNRSENHMESLSSGTFLACSWKIKLICTYANTYYYIKSLSYLTI